jgi:hypothetical protein
MSEKEWKQFVKFFGEKNKHLSSQQVLQQAKKPFQQLQKLFKQRGGEGTVLDLSDRKYFDRDDFEAALETDEEYTSIILNNCGMTDDDLMWLCKRYLKDSGSITKLDLSDNEITDEGITYLCYIIDRTEFSPDEINLSNNNIGNYGLYNLASSLHDTGMTELNVMGNDYGELGLLGLAHCLRHRLDESFEIHIDSKEILDEMMEAILYNPGLKVKQYWKGKALKMIDKNSEEVKKAKKNMREVCSS